MASDRPQGPFPRPARIAPLFSRAHPHSGPTLDAETLQEGVESEAVQEGAPGGTRSGERPALGFGSGQGLGWWDQPALGSVLGEESA